MLVEIPDPEVLLSVILIVFVGLFSIYAYFKIKQVSGLNTKNKAEIERLEFYEKQLIDMKIRLDSIDIENLSLSNEIPKNFENYEEKIYEKVSKPQINERKSVPVSPQSRRTPNMSLDNTVEVVLGLITDRSMTSRDIQVTLSRSREHVSRMMKKLFEDGYVERNIETKPYSYSITQKGRAKIGSDQNTPQEIIPQAA